MPRAHVQVQRGIGYAAGLRYATAMLRTEP